MQILEKLLDGSLYLLGLWGLSVSTIFSFLQKLVEEFFIVFEIGKMVTFFSCLSDATAYFWAYLFINRQDSRQKSVIKLLHLEFNVEFQVYIIIGDRTLCMWRVEILVNVYYTKLLRIFSYIYLIIIRNRNDFNDGNVKFELFQPKPSPEAPEENEKIDKNEELW